MIWGPYCTVRQLLHTLYASSCGCVSIQRFWLSYLVRGLPGSTRSTNKYEIDDDVNISPPMQKCNLSSQDVCVRKDHIGVLIGRLSWTFHRPEFFFFFFRAAFVLYACDCIICVCVPLQISFLPFPSSGGATSLSLNIPAWHILRAIA
jgi:hypothetical protein